MVKSHRPKIKNLIGNLSLIPSPFYLLSEIVRWEVPMVRKIGIRQSSSIGKANLELLDGAGYDGIELVPWGLFDENWKINEKRLLNYQKSGMPYFTFHGCYESFPRKFKNVYLNLAERHSKIKEAIKAHIEVAARLKKGDSTILVFHPGVIKTVRKKDEALRNLMENVSSCLDFAKAHNVILTLENMPFCNSQTEFCVESPDLLYVLKKIPHPNLKITFDWGHLNTSILKTATRNYVKKKDRNKDGNFVFHHVNNFIEALGKNIVHAHIHYNRSHLFNLHKIELGFLKNFVVYAFFWTKLAKLIKRSAYLDSCDEHLSLNKIEDGYLGDYEKVIRHLFEKTSISDLGYITHEINPRRIFRFFTYQKNGAEFEDYAEGLKIFKKMTDLNYLGKI